jgi:DNA-binding MarR family transcriptional regulator
MAGVVASLEEQHLIERLADPRGGRGLLARLTPAGEEIVERGRALLVWLEDELLSSLSGSARAEFQEALRRCAEAAESFRRPRGSVIPDHLEESAVR